MGRMSRVSEGREDQDGPEISQSPVSRDNWKTGFSILRLGDGTHCLTWNPFG